VAAAIAFFSFSQIGQKDGFKTEWIGVIGGYHRKAGQKGTQFLFVSSNLPRLKRVP
jgi:hypothetical protein